ncbi:hypothetical protein JNK13_03410 [bacterium]|nr:hypothetical protein [bacterium]
MNRILKTLVTISASYAMGITLAQAQPIAIETPADNNVHGYTFTPADASRGITFFYVSNGKISKASSFTLRGPTGLIGRVTTKQITSSVPEALASSAGLYSVFYKKNGKTTNAIEVGQGTGGTGGGSGGGGGSQCDIFNQSFYFNFYCSIYRNECNPCTKECLCEQVYGGGGTGGGGGGGGDPTSYGQASMRIRKDACSAIDKYLVRVDLDFSKLTLNSSINVSMQISEFEYNGSRAFKIKKKPDGKYNKSPLGLPAVPGGGSPAGIDVVSFKNRVPAKVTKNSPKDRIYYRGQSLWRVPLANSIFKGGKGTFEIYAGTRIYSHCAKLKKTDQRFGGYRN